MTGELKPPPHLSVSSIQTFQQCPQKFKFNKIDLIPDRSNHWAVLGNFVHDIAEEFYNTPPEMRTIENARPISRRMWDEKWGSEANKVIDGFKITYKLQSKSDEEALLVFRYHAWWCIENLWAVEAPENVNTVGLEYEVNTEIGGVRIKGFIDRISQSTDSMFLTVSDYKTGKTPKPAYEDDKFFQLFVYAKLLSILEVGETDKVELIYLKDSKKITRPVSDSDLSKAVNTIQDAKTEIDKRCVSGHFEANKSTLCNYCSYKSICPIWKK